MPLFPSMNYSDRFLWRCGAAMLLALLLDIAVPSSARAGCGDQTAWPVTIVGPSRGVHWWVMPPLSDPAPVRPRACRGPACSRDVPTPATPRAPVVRHASQWAALLGIDSGQSQRPFPPVAVETAPHPIRRPRLVEHPPRLASWGDTIVSMW